MNSTDPRIASALTALSNLIKIAGIALGSAGLITPGLNAKFEIYAGLVMVIGPALWDVWASFSGLRQGKAEGVQAGINLTVSGRTVDSEGNPISAFASDASPPKPVTLASAAQIVKTFGPTEAIAKH